MNFNRFRKTRIAPTPSGYCHLGNAYSFLVTQSLAQKTGASILLRIDDLDRERFREEYLIDIFETLEFLGIEWDEGPSGPDEFHSKWSQANRKEKYQEALEQLKASGKVFGCTCSRSELSGFERYPGYCIDKKLDLGGAETAWRLFGDDRPLTMNTPDGWSVHDLPGEMANLIVKKRDGYPSYHLASVVDDLLFGVDLVVRGADLQPSTLGQLSLANQLGYSQFGQIAFVHHPILTSSDGLKLSKSAGSDSVRTLRLKGLCREEVIGRVSLAVGGGFPE